MLLNLIFSVIIICGVIISFFLSIVIYTIKFGNIRANKCISLFTITVMLFLLNGFVINSNFFLRFPEITLFLGSFKFLFGPAILFYTYAVINYKNKLHFKDIIHLAPFILYIFYTSFIIFTHKENLSHYILYWLNSSALQPEYILDSLFRLFMPVCLCGYLIYSKRLIKKYEQMSEKLTEIETKYLAWIRIFINYLIPVLVLWVILSMLMITGFTNSQVYVPMHVMISLIVFISGYSILVRPEVLYSAKPINRNNKYSTSPLTRKDIKKYFENIIRLMETEELFLNPKFDLSALSKRVNLPRNHLSQIINEETGMSFNDFINSYRIKKVKEWLENPSQNKSTISNIAYKAGFNSRATFNRAFKDNVGIAPSVFRKKFMLGKEYLN